MSTKGLHYEHGTSNWTPERVERVIALYKDRLSFKKIAAAMTGISRNGVMGKIHRLIGAGVIEKRPEFTNQQRAEHLLPYVRERKEIARAKRAEAVIEVAPAPVLYPLILEDGSHVTIRTINDRRCRFPIGDPSKPDFHYCGHPPKVSKPYCEPHCETAYQKPHPPK